MQTTVGQHRSASNSGQFDSRDVPTFSANGCLVGILRKELTARRNVRIAAKGLGEVILLGSQGTFVPTVADMGKFCAAPLLWYEVTPIATPRVEPGSPPGRKAEELLWSAAFHASHGRLLEECLLTDLIRMPYWPNMTRLPVTDNSMRICARLVNYSTTVVLLASILKIDRSEVLQFYSAAFAAGFVTVLNREGADTAQPVLDESSHSPTDEAPANEEEEFTPDEQPKNQRLFGLLFKKLLGL